MNTDYTVTVSDALDIEYCDSCNELDVCIVITDDPELDELNLCPNCQ